MKKIIKKTAVKKVAKKPAAKKVAEKPIVIQNIKIEDSTRCSACACTGWGVLRWILTPIAGIASTFGFTLLFTYIASVLKLPNRLIQTCMDQLCVYNKLFLIFIVSLVIAFIPTYYVVRWFAPKRKVLSAWIFIVIMVIFLALRMFGIL